MMDCQNKLTHLQEILRDMDSILVSFSAGVDSTFLSFMAHKTLGAKAFSVYAYSDVSLPAELNQARLLATKLNLRFLTINSTEMSNPLFVANDKDRCYYCKQGLYRQLKDIARLENLKWVADGSIQDDLDDYRPGRRASLESGVRSPLLESGLTKAEIRRLSKDQGLETWDKPASPCLASRIPYGTPVSIETLSKISKGEEYLRSLGLRQVRLRHHGDIARIEVGFTEMDLVLNSGIRSEITNKLKEIGYLYVTLDLSGYRTGSLNIAFDKAGEKIPHD